ncbi:Telomere stability and silencing [Teratosphaeria destructans]|uniref:Telomere stability and silencing n=1 Tax=Teratosphaeria destructans TaxID=418781 RepID=A0A9W7SQM6_9PEZI|nr:Telomere stability and silencing [Teratosphaeria destructans]
MASTNIMNANTSPPLQLQCADEQPHTINVLLTSFAGLGLPRTLALPIAATTSINDVVFTVLERLPRIKQNLIITTTNNRQLLRGDDEPVARLLSDPKDTFLPLRLSTRLCGGKGGFGSQLRAAGGRMSSRKNRNSTANPNASNRNLDGRRLRTVDEAKKLAEYLAIKPEMEKKEKEERRRRWEEVVQAAERREEEIKSGKTGSNQGRLDAEYVESKEKAEEQTREAVLRAMRVHMADVERTGSESSAEAEDGESDKEGEEGSSGSSADAENDAGGPSFFGWDEDEEGEDDDEHDEHDQPEQNAPSAAAEYEGKGKGVAT